MRIIETNQGEALVILNNIDSVKTSKIKEVLSGETPVVDVPPIVVTPPVEVENTNSGVTVKADSLNNKEERFFKITGPIKGIAYANKPDDFGAFYGGVFVQKLSVWEVILLLNNNSKVKVKLDWSGSFQLTGSDIITEAPTQVEPTTPPVVDQVPTIPTTNGSEGNFNPSGFLPDMFAIGEAYQVPGDRTKIQLSSFSMNHGARGLDCYVKQYGKLISKIKVKDGDTSIGYFNNNHSMMTQIVIKSGPIEIGYKNEIGEDYHIVLGIAKIRNNEAYLFYYPDGLIKQNPLFVKELARNEHYVANFDVVVSDDYGKVEPYNGGNLYKDWTLNFFKDNQPYFEEMEWTGGSGNYYELKHNAPLRANSERIYKKIRSKKDHNLFVEVEITTGGYGETGTVKLLNASGLTISKDLVKISTYVFNYDWINQNGGNEYNIREGLKDCDYKVYSNGGKIGPDRRSIIQEQDI